MSGRSGGIGTALRDRASHLDRRLKGIERRQKNSLQDGRITKDTMSGFQ